MELWWLLPGGFVAFFVFAYIKGLIYAKKTMGSIPPLQVQAQEKLATK